MCGQSWQVRPNQGDLGAPGGHTSVSVGARDFLRRKETQHGNLLVFWNQGDRSLQGWIEREAGEAAPCRSGMWAAQPEPPGEGAA